MAGRVEGGAGVAQRVGDGQVAAPHQRRRRPPRPPAPGPSRPPPRRPSLPFLRSRARCPPSGRKAYIRARWRAECPRGGPAPAPGPGVDHLRRLPAGARRPRLVGRDGRAPREFGFSTEAARAALARLATRELIARTKVGRPVFYTVTPRATAVLEEGDGRIFGFGDGAPTGAGERRRCSGIRCPRPTARSGRDSGGGCASWASARCRTPPGSHPTTASARSSRSWTRSGSRGTRTSSWGARPRPCTRARSSSRPGTSPRSARPTTSSCASSRLSARARRASRSTTGRPSSCARARCTSSAGSVHGSRAARRTRAAALAAAEGGRHLPPSLRGPARPLRRATSPPSPATATPRLTSGSGTTSSPPTTARAAARTSCDWS